MNWIKQNKKLAAIVGVMIAGGLGLGAMLYLAWSDYSAQRDHWVDLDRKAVALENAKFTPNADNVALLGQKLDEYRDKFALLQKVLLSEKLQQKETPITETDFQARLKERSKAVVQKAGKLSKVPKDFALGFDEYTASLPPSPEVAAKLNVHLDVIEKLVNTLLDAGVTSIDQLERTRLPEERGGAAAAPQQSTAPKPAPPGNKPKPGPVAPVGAAVVDRYPVKLVFTCDSGPLQTVLNSLANPAKTPQFLAVRLVRVENEKQEAPSKDEIRVQFKTPPAPVTPPPGPEDKGAKRPVPVAAPLPPDSIIVMGREDLHVYLEVDYLRFRPGAPEGAAAPAPAAKP